jgi:phosphatidylinositol dimannoside acyltransferase
VYDWIASLTGDERRSQRIGWLCGLVPRGVLLLLCHAVGLLLFAAAGTKLRERVLRNMTELLPERKRGELKRMQRHYFQNMVMALYEIMIEGHRLPGSSSWRFLVEGEERLEEALRLGRGAIVYTPHVGNFFYYYWYLCQKYSCLTVATASSNELRPLYLKFQAMGCPGLDYDETPPLELYRALKKHLQAGGVVLLLGDFYRPTFPRSRLFGRVTRTPEGGVTLAIEQQVPVIPFYGRRERGFVHRLVFGETLHLYSSFTKATRSDAALLLNRFMEQVIREHPEEWFYWFNAEERWEQEASRAASSNEAQSHTA